MYNTLQLWCFFQISVRVFSSSPQWGHLKLYPLQNMKWVSKSAFVGIITWHITHFWTKKQNYTCNIHLCSILLYKYWTNPLIHGFFQSTQRLVFFWLFLQRKMNICTIILFENTFLTSPFISNFILMSLPAKVCSKYAFWKCGPTVALLILGVQRK